MLDLLFSPNEERMRYEYTTEWQFVALSRVPANQQRTGKMTQRRFSLRSETPLEIYGGLTEKDVNQLRLQGVVVCTEFRDVAC
ncbi:hypothetical protein [Vibrio parahaemolyticus]|uniref:hypothetical protein n=1 Tax=Vibrio parahaemolyticus TaxID=670 RepID=UPI00111F570B|nr:hypothetical protein [Vibrio parahaemolyticus]TOG95089.1 hypothetical protein CGI92_14115 [Vibrio parahaemolyticus]